MTSDERKEKPTFDIWLKAVLDELDGPCERLQEYELCEHEKDWLFGQYFAGLDARSTSSDFYELFFLPENYEEA